MEFSVWIEQFVDGMKTTGPLEYVGVFAGIISVWFSKKENVWVFPTGLINTILYIYLSAKEHLFGEATVNVYYTLMSIYGWILWSRRDKQHQKILHITHSSKKEWLWQLLFFAVFYLILYFALQLLKNNFYDSVIPWADAFASATAFTGMWLMARKKVESWYWWIATNIASIPLYFVKDYVFTSVYYIILLALAFAGLQTWKRKAKLRNLAHYNHL